MYTKSMFFPALLSVAMELLPRQPEWLVGADGFYPGREDDDTVNSNMYLFPYSIFLAGWSIMLLEMWKRREWELKFLWGSEGFEKAEQPRPQFSGVPTRNLLTGAVSLIQGNSKVWFLKMAASTALTLVVMAFNGYLLFQAVLIKNNGRQYVADDSTASSSGAGETETDGTPVLPGEGVGIDLIDQKQEIGIEVVDNNYFAVLAGVLNLLIIVIFGSAYQGLAEKLTEWENHRTQTEWEDSLIIKSFAFQFVNNYFTLFYIGILRQSTKSDKCMDPSCMDEITMQLLIIFTGKTLAKKFVDLSKPFIMRRIGVRVAKMKVKLNNKQVNRLRELVMFEDGIELEEQRKKELERIAREELESMEGPVELDPIQMEARRPTKVSTFEDYSELSIQFGYLSFFSPAFPMACLLAFVANLFDIRSDAVKLCKGFRRVRWQHAEDIGSWYGVLAAISFVAVISNACLLGFVSTQMTMPGSPEESNIVHRFRSYSVWIGVVAFEHGVLTLKLVLQAVSPDVPSWIAKAKEELAYQKKEVLLTDKQKEKRAILKAGLKQHEERVLSLDGEALLSSRPDPHGYAKNARSDSGSGRPAASVTPNPMATSEFEIVSSESDGED